MNNNFDVDNYVYVTDCIKGPWSYAHYLNSSGFDPSLFHDDDGRKWIINLEWDFRKGYEHPGAIVLEEFDAEKMVLMGNPIRISRGGTDRGCLEGPQIYKRNNYYYLITAEGGTGYGHAVVVSRSKNLEVPYESFSEDPVITSQPLNFYYSQSLESKCLGIMVGQDGHKDELLEHRVVIDQSVNLVYL